MGAQEHRPPPEIAQELAPDFLVLDVPGRFRLRYRRDLLVEHDADELVLAGIERHLPRGAEAIAGGEIPALAFATLHRELDGMTVGAMKRLLTMKERLHPIIPRREVRDAVQRITERVGADDRVVFRTEPLDADAGDELRVGTVGT